VKSHRHRWALRQDVSVLVGAVLCLSGPLKLQTSAVSRTITDRDQSVLPLRTELRS
jgi:hypothetical protein